MQRHLGGDVFQLSHFEVRGPHPGFDRAVGVLDGHRTNCHFVSTIARRFYRVSGLSSKATISKQFSICPPQQSAIRNWTSAFTHERFAA